VGGEQLTEADMAPIAVPDHLRRLLDPAGIAARLQPDPPPHKPGTAYAVIAKCKTGVSTQYTTDREAAIAEGRRLKAAGFQVKVGGVTVMHDHRGREWVAKVEIDLGPDPRRRTASAQGATIPAPAATPT
jgi:hypothetical protein